MNFGLLNFIETVKDNGVLFEVGLNSFCIIVGPQAYGDQRVEVVWMRTARIGLFSRMLGPQLVEFFGKD